MRRLYQFLAGILAIIFFLWGISAYMQSRTGNVSDKLVIYNWGDYIDPDLLTKFTKETGIKVQYETFDRIPLFVVAPVAEQVVAKSAFVGCLQKTGRNNLVGVHILQRKWHAGAGNYIEFLFHLFFIFFVENFVMKESGDPLHY